MKIFYSKTIPVKKDVWREYPNWAIELEDTTLYGFTSKKQAQEALKKKPVVHYDFNF